MLRVVLYQIQAQLHHKIAFYSSTRSTAHIYEIYAECNLFILYDFSRLLRN